MNANLRFTGENPPPELLSEYPNWENAYDEEGVEGQDETTLRPAENQSVIEEYTSFAAAEVVLNSGQKCPALIYMIEETAGLDVYVRGKWHYINRKTDRFHQFLCWEPLVLNQANAEGISVGCGGFQRGRRLIVHRRGPAAESFEFSVGSSGELSHA